LQDDASDTVIELHDLSTDIMLVVIALHIAGVFVSSILHRENLVRSMITGFKQSDSSDGIGQSFNWLGILMLAIVAVFGFVYLQI